VLDLIQHPDRLNSMRTAARQRAESHFDLSASVAETSALFNRMVRPAVRKNGVWQPTVVRDKLAEGDRRVRLKTQTGAIKGIARGHLAALRTADTA
jgi:hypothetical protein